MNEEEKFAGAFVEEAIELFTKMEEVILCIENDLKNPELINHLFRIIHTLKGSGAMFGFGKMADFAHHLETALDLIRNGKLHINHEFIDLLLRSRDLLQAMLYPSQIEPEHSLEKEKILVVLKQMQGKISEEKQMDAPLREELPIAASKEVIYRLRIKLHPHVMSSGMDPLCLFDEIRSLGECTILAHTDQIPLLEEINPACCYLYWDAIINTKASLETLKNIFLFVQDEGRISITPLTSESSETEENYKKLGEILVERGDLTEDQVNQVLAKQKRTGQLMVEEGLVSRSKIESALLEQEMVKKVRGTQAQADNAQTNNIRVSTEKLDRLINLVGEMVITQAQLSQTSTRYKDRDLLTYIENMQRLTNDLRDCALNIRMLPIETTFGKFRRLVRDLSASLGKDIELITEGGETEVDKTVIERIHDPLVHVIRNSIDHGIEPPQVRQKKGKQPQGTIRLSAGQAGGEVVICIEDDGAGLDQEKIRAKAIERNLISGSDHLTESQIFNMIFQPGFSTAEKVTDVSGRGVGMDVVRREITKLRGSVGIESKKGEGTKISIFLPLTLAIIEGLLIAVDNRRYVVPLTFVQECVEITGQDIEKSHGRHIIHVRGETIPYIRLREIFCIEGNEHKPKFEYVVIIRFEEKRIGLVTDKIIGNYQAVIKSLGKVYEHTEGVSGATILGDGTIALILDVRQLAKCADKEEKEMLNRVS